MERKSIMIDMDEVIVKCRFPDFLKEFLGEVDFSKLSGFNRQELLKGKEEDYSKQYAKRSLYNNDDGSFVLPIENSVEIINKLSEKYDVYIVTSYTWSGGVVDAGYNLKYKFDYLKHYFPFLNENNFVFLCDKSKMRFDIGIDDRINNLKTCNKKLLFTEFRNENISDDELKQQGVIRVDSWKDIEEILL